MNLGIIERAVSFGENPDTSKRGVYRMRDDCYDFWFRFVMPYASDIKSSLGKTIAAALSDARLNEYLGRRFEPLCLEWLVMKAKEGKLPIPAMTVGSWWGTNPATKSQTGIDVLAADKIGKTLLIGECKYREEFNASDVVDDLLGKRALVKGYVADSLYVFAKHPVSKAVTWMQPSCPWRRRTGRNGGLAA